VTTAWPGASKLAAILFAGASRLIPNPPNSAPIGALALFGGEDSRADAVARVKREIKERRGRFAIRSGATPPLYAIYRDTANACDVRGKMCF
jgi:hypothetical protein